MKETKFRVVDPQAVYPIFAVECFAENWGEARTMALEAMMGCPCDEVDEQVVEDSLLSLEVEGMLGFSFATFLGTKQYHPNLEAVNPNAVQAKGGYGYLDNELYIEDVSTWDSPESKKPGRWYLCIANREWRSDNLDELEHILYQWALREGYDETYSTRRP